MLICLPTNLPQPRLCDGHHLRAHGMGACLSDDGRRMVQSQGAGLATVGHAGNQDSA